VLFRIAVILLVFAGLSGAQSPSAANSSDKIAGLDLKALDTSVNACEDFYRYACGSWMKNNPVPPDQSRWGRFNELQENNQKILRGILEAASAAGGNRNPADQKIGDYYASCMDEGAIERKGTAGLRPVLDKIGALTAKPQIAGLVADLHTSGISALFRFSSTEDFKNATQMIAEVDQGGLGLPDRDYYLKEDDKSKELREKYLEHMKRMFALAGADATQAAANAGTVMRIETALAQASLDRVSRRDPDKIYHKWQKNRLIDGMPAFAWPRYFELTGVPSFESLNVAVPDFFAGLGKLIDATPLEDWKTYLTWHALHASVSLLPKAFVDEDFGFYGKTLRGAQEIRPRWKRCVSYTDSDLGEALGQSYVEKYFPPESKKQMLELVHALEKALRADIHSLPWMTETTKKQALHKLESISNKIGYPDNWRDYSRLEIVRGDALGNSQRANRFQFQRDLNKVGKPADRNEWVMSPPTVNAYYHPLHNNINFPAGILQPPFFDASADDALNFGAIGAVIGHELTHGFDDQGRKFDAGGNLNDWWTEEDGAEFEKRASCFEKQYAGYTAVDDVKLNGKLTLGENTADNGGLRIAYMALLDTLKGKPVEKIDGFTPQQRFFLGWAQVWCQNSTPESSRMLAQIDPHSPGEYRANGAVSNMQEFGEAFGCQPAQPMVKSNACRVW
jgi:endothelin-converting enzyme/putative endopeptidase